MDSVKSSEFCGYIDVKSPVVRIDFFRWWRQFTVRFRDAFVMVFGVICVCDGESSAVGAPFSFSAVLLRG